MVTKEEIERINHLARKQKCSDLSPEEKSEQDALRRKYMDSMKTNLKAQLENIVPLKQNDNEPDNCLENDPNPTK